MGLNEYSEVKDGGYFPLENCPECKTHSLLVQGDGFLCFNCSSEWDSDDLATCSYCNEYYIIKDDDIGMCDDCRFEKSRKFMDNNE